MPVNRNSKGRFIRKAPLKCPSCSYYASSKKALASHKVTFHPARR